MCRPPRAASSPTVHVRTSAKCGGKTRGHGASAGSYWVSAAHRFGPVSCERHESRRATGGETFGAHGLLAKACGKEQGRAFPDGAAQSFDAERP